MAKQMTSSVIENLQDNEEMRCGTTKLRVAYSQKNIHDDMTNFLKNIVLQVAPNIVDQSFTSKLAIQIPNIKVPLNI